MNLNLGIDPTLEPAWDTSVSTWNSANIFHTSNWASVLKETYGYKCTYAMSDDGRILVPMMEVNSWLTGKRGISLPFSDYCQPLFKSKDDLSSCFKFIKTRGKAAKWKYVEWRGQEELFPGEKPYSTYYCHELDIRRQPKDLIKTFRKGTKSAIKKAERDGLLKIKIANSLESIKEYYQLHCKTRKRLGVPPQPFEFFKNIFDFVLSKDKGIVASAFCAQKIIASGVFLHSGNRVIYKFGASDPSFMKLRPTNLLLWRVINYYQERDYAFFNFGRTDLFNKGLLSFKRGWGTSEFILKYYRYDLEKERFIQKSSFKRGIKSEQLFRKMPIPFLKLIGQMLYRHMA